MCGFTEEDSSFLEEKDPLAYMYDNDSEVYVDIGFIDFLPILKNLVDLNNLFKKYDLQDSLICTATYYYLRSSYEYKLYLLLTWNCYI